MLTSETMNSMGRCSRELLQKREVLSRRRDHHPCLQRVADLLALAKRFERRVDGAADVEKPFPHVEHRLVDERRDLSGLREQRQVHRFLAAGCRRQMCPQLFGRDGQNWRQQAREPVRHDVHHRLRRAPLARRGRERIQAILGHVAVERTQVDRHERVERLEDRGVVVFVVRLQNAAGNLSVSGEHVSVDAFELVQRHHIGRRVKIVQVRHEIAQRIARLSVRFDDSREDFLAHAQLFRVIAHRHPQPQDFRAAFLDDVLRRDDVADRFRHLPAFEVDQKSVGQHFPIGRRSVRPEADEQRALKPPAVLIAAFQVHVRRPGQVRPSGQARPDDSIPNRTTHRECPARARIQCRRTKDRPAALEGTPRWGVRTRRQRHTCRRHPPPSRRAPA